MWLDDPSRLPSGVRRKATGEQAVIREIPPSRGARRFSRGARLKLVERKDAEEKNYNAYALGTNAVAKERHQVGANLRAKR